MTRDESLRGAERRAALAGPASDLAALERLVIERQRAEDPLTKLRAIVKRAQDLRRDVHFGLDDMARHLRYVKGQAYKNARRGIALPGYAWARHGDGELRLMKFMEPIHVPRFAPRGPGRTAWAPGYQACETCGADLQLEQGKRRENPGPNMRCVVEAAVGEGVRGGEAIGLGWWRGTPSVSGEPVILNELETWTVTTGPGLFRGLRHLALAYWDEPAGLVALEVKTASGRETVQKAFPVLKVRKLAGGSMNIREDLMREWATTPDPGRVLMTVRYAMGPDRNAAMPLWEDLTVIKGRAHR